MPSALNFEIFQELNPLIIIGSIIIGFLFLFILSTWPHHVPKSIPGPGRTIPYFGAVFKLLEEFERLPDFIVEETKKHNGKTWGAPMPKLGMLRGSAYFLTSTESVKHVLKDNFENYEKGETVRDGLGEFLGEGIFATDGLVWKFHRKVASRMFTNRLLKESTLVANKHTNRLINHLKSKCIQEDTSSTTIVDMQDMFFRLTMDIFTFIAFGEDLESVTRIHQHEFAVAFDTIQACTEKRFSNPMWRVLRAFQLSEGERKIRQGTIIVNDFAKQVIDGKRRVLNDLNLNSTKEKKKNNDNNEEEYQLGPDLLSRFLEDAANKKDDINNNESKTGGSDKELRDIVLNFMIAGRDTTACALSWTLYELLKSPKILLNVKKEFQEIFNKSIANKTDVTYDDIQTLNYTHAVILEVLRLHPSVPKDIKYAIKSDILPDGTHIPSGATVIYSPYAMGRDDQIWENPYEFKPERFLNKTDDNNTKSAINEPSVYTYPVFNAGPRLCLGKPLALMEIKLIIGMLLCHFKIEFASSEGHNGGYASTIVLPMKPGLMVKLTPIE